MLSTTFQSGRVALLTNMDELTLEVLLEADIEDISISGGIVLVSGKPYMLKGLTSEELNLLFKEDEDKAHAFGDMLGIAIAEGISSGDLPGPPPPDTRPWWKRLFGL